MNGAAVPPQRQHSVAGDRCVVLMYHIIASPQTEAERQWCCEPDQFRLQMRWLRESGYVPIGIGRLDRWLAGGEPLPPNAVCVTFDDGTRCLRATALPILKEYDFPAVSYVVAGLVGGSNTWLRSSGWSERDLLGVADLRALREAGIEIGSHSMTHADLSACEAGLRMMEVRDSRYRLEDTLGEPVEHFAYPFGRLNRDAYARVQEAGYRTAVTVADGVVRRTDNPLLLNRVEVFHWDDLSRFKRKVRWGIADPTLSLQSIKRMTHRVLHRSGLRTRKLQA
jgi:peptidoglycan/xylan/chitin deacetylase (PgdA/CDA1 family)